MPANIVKNKAEEKLWDDAKAQAGQEGKSENYGYITAIFKSMRDGHAKKMKQRQLAAKALAR
jgi:hypothetical protein